MDICTYNAGNGTSTEVAADFRRLAAAYPIIGAVEVADRHRQLNATGLQVLTGDGGGRGKAALLTSLPVASTGYVPCTPRTFVGTWGAGPSTIDAKGIRWARVQVDSQDVTVGVTHLVPSVQRPAKGPVARLGLRRRRALYRKHIAAIVRWAATAQGPLVIVGDFNATPDFPLLEPLRAAGLTCSTAASHPANDPGRAIDHHWSRGIDPLVVEALDGFSSDHKPVAVTYEIPDVPPPDPDPFVLPDRWARVKFRGKVVDNDLKYRLLAMERILGYKLTLVQGINPGGVAQSGGTHDGPAVDLAPYDWENKVHVGREFAALAIWHRTPAEGDWGEHEHGVPIGNKNLSWQAARQVEDYLANPPRNGLANHAPDTFPYRPDPVIPFDYPAAVRDVYRVKRIRTIQGLIRTQRERISAIQARMKYARQK